MICSCRHLLMFLLFFSFSPGSVPTIATEIYNSAVAGIVLVPVALTQKVIFCSAYLLCVWLYERDIIL